MKRYLFFPTRLYKQLHTDEPLNFIHSYVNIHKMENISNHIFRSQSYVSILRTRASLQKTFMVSRNLSQCMSIQHLENKIYWLIPSDPFLIALLSRWTLHNLCSLTTIADLRYTAGLNQLLNTYRRVDAATSPT